MKKLLLLIMLLMLAVPAYAQENGPTPGERAPEEEKRENRPSVPDPGNGGMRFQVLGASGGARAYNVGFWAWNHGGTGNIDLTAILDDEMGDVYGLDVMIGILVPHRVTVVPALGATVGYNTDRDRLFLALYPELSLRVLLGEEVWDAELAIVARYYLSTEGLGEDLFFYGVALNLTL